MTTAHRRDLACVALLAALTCAFFEAVVFRGRTLALRDLTGEFGPWQMYARECLASGELPLWCPHNDCGYPFLASIMPAVLYPLNGLFHFASFGRAIGVFAGVHTWLAGTFTYALVRVLGSSSLAGLVAGIAYMFGGWYVTRLEFLSWFGSLTWQPLVLLCAYRTVDKRSTAWAVAWGCAGAIQIFAGHPDSVVFTALMVALFVGGYLAFRLPGLGLCGLAKSAGLMAIAGSVCWCLAGAQLLPTVELAALSDRAAGLTFDEAASRSVFPMHWLTWLVPRAFGGVGYDRYWGGTLHEFSSGCCYVGVAPVLLAVAACGAARIGRRWLAATFAAIALIGIALAMGRYAPFYRWVFDHLPLVGKLRWPMKFLALPVMSVCVLAAVGVDVVAAGAASRPGRARLWPILMVNLPIALVVALLLLPNTAALPWVQRVLTSQTYPNQWRWRCFERFHSLAVFDGLKFWVLLNLSLAALWALRSAKRRPWGRAALVAVVAADLFVFAKPINWAAKEDAYEAQAPNVEKLRGEPGPFRVYVPDAVLYANNWLYGVRNPQAFLWAKNTLLANRNLPYAIDAVHSDYPLDMARYRRVLVELESPRTTAQARARLLSMLNVTYAIDAPGVQAPALVRMRDFRRSARMRWVGSSRRAWVVPAVRSASDADALATLRSDRFDPEHEALVAAPGVDASYPARQGGLRLSARRRHETTIEWQGGAGFLVLSESHYPGWRLYDNGRLRPIVRTNYAFRGAAIGAGARQLRFVYAPRSFKLGAALTLMGVAGLGLLGCLRVGRAGQ